MKLACQNQHFKPSRRALLRQLQRTCRATQHMARAARERCSTRQRVLRPASAERRSVSLWANAGGHPSRLRGKSRGDLPFLKGGHDGVSEEAAVFFDMLTVRYACAAETASPTLSAVLL